VLDAALSHSSNGKVFAAYLHSASAHEIAKLRLGKKAEQLYVQAANLHKRVDRYAYLCGYPHRYAYAERRVMPSDGLDRALLRGVGV
jgi:hypothetical protein